MLGPAQAIEGPDRGEDREKIEKRPRGGPSSKGFKGKTHQLEMEMIRLLDLIAHIIRHYY